MPKTKRQTLVIIALLILVASVAGLLFSRGDISPSTLTSLLPPLLLPTSRA